MSWSSVALYACTGTSNSLRLLYCRSTGMCAWMISDEYRNLCWRLIRPLQGVWLVNRDFLNRNLNVSESDFPLYEMFHKNVLFHLDTEDYLPLCTTVM